MLNSVIAILAQYIDDATPYNLYSVEMERGQNGDDLYYLCNVAGEFYIVFETDYIDPRPYQATEAAELFASDDMQLVGWIARKNAGKIQDKMIDLDVSLGDKTYHDALVSSLEGSYLAHAVLKARQNKAGKKHYHPHAYSSAQ